MSTFSAYLLAFLLICMPLRSAALELVSPPTEGTLQNERVRVVGMGTGAHKGKVSFLDQSTTFRVSENGYFNIVLNLGKGTHEVKFQVGEEELLATWTIDPKAGEGTYKYHPEFEDGGCEACHESNPILKTDVDVLVVCQRCHTPFGEKKFTHGPVAVGSCADCHDPHGSTFPSYIFISQKDLCIDCHNQPITAEHRSQAGGKQCLDCHDPHESDQPFQLSNPPK